MYRCLDWWRNKFTYEYNRRTYENKRGVKKWQKRNKRKVYAKGNSIDREPEPDTIKFRENKEGSIILEQRENLKPGDVDHFTIVIWIEGDDPECIDALIGGEISLHMNITEEHMKIKEEWNKWQKRNKKRAN